MKKNISKDQIIDVTMNLIIQKNGSLNINIRDIAKELGCSHPNIYNYFSDLNELLWDCLGAALRDMMSSVIPCLDQVTDPDTKFKTFFTALLDYSLSHMAWYKLIWYDPMSKDIPDHIKPLLVLPGQYLVNFLMEIYPQLQTIDQAGQISRIIHRYLHGEISTKIAARGIHENDAEFHQLVIQNCEMLMQNYIQKINK